MKTRNYFQKAWIGGVFLQTLRKPSMPQLDLNNLIKSLINNYDKTHVHPQPTHTHTKHKTLKLL